MTTEPKLLTEGEAKALWKAHYTGKSLDDYKAELRERGLFAPEPEPEPPVEIALKAALERCNGFHSEYGKVAWSNGFREGFDRGMELRPTLTREMVAKAWEKVMSGNWVGDFFGRLHAALVEQMK